MRILQKTKYDLSGHTDENSLYQYRLREPAKLTKNIIYEVGIDSGMYPLLSLTEGQKGLSTYTPKLLNDTSYTWPVMGRMKHITELVSVLGGTTSVGLGHTYFDVVFKDQRAIPTYGMYTPDRKHMVRIQKEHGRYSNGTVSGYRYTLQLQGGDATASIAAANFTSGKHWVLAAPTTPESKGLGNRSHTMGPGEMTNQYGFYRFSKEISGNVANFDQDVVQVEFDLAKGGKTTKWMPWEMYQWDLDKLLLVEEDLWDQEYNRLENGEYTIYDEDSQEPIIRGAGIKQQIREGGIYDTYNGKLYLDKLKTISNEMFRDEPDGGIMDITLVTGIGGAEEIDSAIKADVGSSGFEVAMGHQAINGSGNHLSYGAYFKQYKTIKGHTITTKIGNLFDNGLKAEMAKANGDVMPGTNLPITSYDMIFLDNSTYNGEKNIQATAMKGQEYITGVYKGLTPIPDSWAAATGGNLLSTRRDMSAYEIKMSKGVSILKAKNCVYLEAAL
jgi:hypothetical protein